MASYVVLHCVDLAKIEVYFLEYSEGSVLGLFMKDMSKMEGSYEIAVIFTLGTLAQGQALLPLMCIESLRSHGLIKLMAHNKVYTFRHPAEQWEWFQGDASALKPDLSPPRTDDFSLGRQLFKMSY